MTKTVNDIVLDAALEYVQDNGNKLYICSSAATSYANAVSDMLASITATPEIVSTIANGDTSGRKIAISAISGLTVTTSGTATHIAIVDTDNSEVLAVTELTTPVDIGVSDPIDISGWDIEIGDPT